MSRNARFGNACFSDALNPKTPLSARWAQMSMQAQIIEQKKLEIQAKLDAQKRATLIAKAQKAVSGDISDEVNAVNNGLVNIFSNDGSFLDQFKKINEITPEAKEEKISDAKVDEQQETKESDPQIDNKEKKHDSQEDIKTADPVSEDQTPTTKTLLPIEANEDNEIARNVKVESDKNVKINEDKPNLNRSRDYENNRERNHNKDRHYDRDGNYERGRVIDRDRRDNYWHKDQDRSNPRDRSSYRGRNDTRQRNDRDSRHRWDSSDGRYHRSHSPPPSDFDNMDQSQYFNNHFQNESINNGPPFPPYNNNPPQMNNRSIMPLMSQVFTHPGNSMPPGMQNPPFMAQNPPFMNDRMGPPPMMGGPPNPNMMNNMPMNMPPFPFPNNCNMPGPPPMMGYPPFSSNQMQPPPGPLFNPSSFAGPNFNPGPPQVPPLLSIPEPEPLKAVTIPPPEPMNLHLIPPPMPISLNQIPKPKEIDPLLIPAPPSSVLSTDAAALPGEGRRADGRHAMAAAHGERDAQRGQESATWYGTDEQGSDYQDYDSSSKGITIRPEDKYEPELCLEDDSDEENENNDHSHTPKEVYDTEKQPERQALEDTDDRFGPSWFNATKEGFESNEQKYFKNEGSIKQADGNDHKFGQFNKEDNESFDANDKYDNSQEFGEDAERPTRDAKRFMGNIQNFERNFGGFEKSGSKSENERFGGNEDRFNQNFGRFEESGSNARSEVDRFQGGRYEPNFGRIEKFPVNAKSEMDQFGGDEDQFFGNFEQSESNPKMETEYFDGNEDRFFGSCQRSESNPKTEMERFGDNDRNFGRFERAVNIPKLDTFSGGEDSRTRSERGDESDHDRSDRQTEKRRKKRKSRWGEESDDGNGMPGMVPPLPHPPLMIPGLTLLGGFNPLIPLPPAKADDVPMLTKVTRTDPALLQYAKMNYGSINLSEEDWIKCEDNYKLNLLFQDMVSKRQQLERLAAAGKHKYEYDSDEDVQDGTWEHKLRTKEMDATKKWATELTKQAAGKHHIGDFLPPEELKKFMEKYSSVKSGKEPDLSDYKEFKLKEDNIGFQMLQKLGWNEGQGLGAEGSGIVQPINNSSNRDTNQGLGISRSDNPDANDDEFDAYRKRMMLAYRFRPNPLNNPRRPYY